MDNTESKAPKALPLNARLFGPVPVLEGEDSASYYELLASIWDDVKPIDTIEKLWVQDFADLTWQILRWRRAKKSLLNETRADVLEDVLERFFRKRDAFGHSPALKKLSDRYVAGDYRAIARLSVLLAKVNMTEVDLASRTLLNQFDTVVRIDDMLGALEARRNTIMRQAAQYREAFGPAFRSAAREIEAVAVKALEPAGDVH